MKLTTKGRYGLRVLIDLARHHQEAPIILSAIGERQGISIHYLEQVMAILKRGQIVKSVKGAYGGYLLAQPPQHLKLKDILLVLEGDLSIIEYEDKAIEENKMRQCIKKNVWDVIDGHIYSTLEHLTLQDMLEEYTALKKGELSYFFDTII